MHSDSAPKSRDLVGNTSHWTPAERAQRLGQRGGVVWFTGLSGSGKSSVAREVERLLVARGRNAFVLDGDNLRQGLNRDLGFSPDERRENIRRIGEVAKLFSEANVICLAAFIAPYRADRALVRSLVAEGHFLEVYCAASLQACEARDVKGLYRRARAGEIPEFTGISAPYEPPERPELRLETGGAQSLAQSAEAVLACLNTHGFF